MRRLYQRIDDTNVFRAVSSMMNLTTSQKGWNCRYHGAVWEEFQI